MKSSPAARSPLSALFLVCATLGFMATIAIGVMILVKFVASHVVLRCAPFC